jgi:hypothetical protein
MNETGRRWLLTIEGVSTTRFTEIKDGPATIGIDVMVLGTGENETLAPNNARIRWSALVAEGAIPVEKTPIRKAPSEDDIKKKEREWLDKFISQHMERMKPTKRVKPTKEDMHSLYTKNKRKHDKDFYKYDNYALEA